MIHVQYGNAVYIWWTQSKLKRSNPYLFMPRIMVFLTPFSGVYFHQEQENSLEIDRENWTITP